MDRTLEHERCSDIADIQVGADAVLSVFNPAIQRVALGAIGPSRVGGTPSAPALVACPSGSTSPLRNLPCEFAREAGLRRGHVVFRATSNVLQHGWASHHAGRCSQVDHRRLQRNGRWQPPPSRQVGLLPGVLDRTASRTRTATSGRPSRASTRTPRARTSRRRLRWRSSTSLHRVRSPRREERHHPRDGRRSPRPVTAAPITLAPRRARLPRRRRLPGSRSSRSASAWAASGVLISEQQPAPRLQRGPPTPEHQRDGDLVE